jgi:hypothetical protein
LALSLSFLVLIVAGVPADRGWWSNRTIVAWNKNKEKSGLKLNDKKKFTSIISSLYYTFLKINP